MPKGRWRAHASLEYEGAEEKKKPFSEELGWDEVRSVGDRYTSEAEPPERWPPDLIGQLLRGINSLRCRPSPLLASSGNIQRDTTLETLANRQNLSIALAPQKIDKIKILEYVAGRYLKGEFEMKTKVLAVSLVGLLWVFTVFAEVPHWKVKDVKSGMKGYGLTVFRGDEPERFEVEILGVVSDGIVPGYSYILARTHGGPGNILDVAENVPGGMSGSPIYVDEKLVGALSFSWMFSRGGVFGVTPFEYMEEEERRGPQRSESAPPMLTGQKKTTSEVRTFIGGNSANYALPQTKLSFAVSRPLYGEVYDATKKLVAGVSLGVAITTGDITIQGTGTVTAVDGDKVYAFGHPMGEGGGEVSLPSWRTPIAGVVPSFADSFKVYDVSWRGERALVRHDGLFGIYGTVTDDPAEMVPIKVSFGNDSFSGMVAQKGWAREAVLSFVYTALAGRSDLNEKTVIRFDGTASFKDLPALSVSEIYSYDTIQELNPWVWPVGTRGAFILATRYLDALETVRAADPNAPLEKLSLSFTEAHRARYVLERAWFDTEGDDGEGEIRAEPGASVILHLLIAEREINDLALRKRFEREVIFMIPGDAKDGTAKVYIEDAFRFKNRASRPTLPSSLAELIEWLNQGVASADTLYLQLEIPRESDTKVVLTKSVVANEWWGITKAGGWSQKTSVELRKVAIPIPNAITTTLSDREELSFRIDKRPRRLPNGSWRGVDFELDSARFERPEVLAGGDAELSLTLRRVEDGKLYTLTNPLKLKIPSGAKPGKYAALIYDNAAFLENYKSSSASSGSMKKTEDEKKQKANIRPDETLVVFIRGEWDPSVKREETTYNSLGDDKAAFDADTAYTQWKAAGDAPAPSGWTRLIEVNATGSGTSVAVPGGMIRLEFTILPKETPKEAPKEAPKPEVVSSAD